MIISLIGYMGSGKSHVSKNLSKKLNFPLIDLDQRISEEHLLSIPEIFQKKGEIFFRKEEKRILETILNEEKDIILSLGGGTPVYYNNMDLINENIPPSFCKNAYRAGPAPEKYPPADCQIRGHRCSGIYCQASFRTKSFLWQSTFYDRYGLQNRY